MKDIDMVAVERVIAGIPTRLNRDECKLAVEEMLARGCGARAIATRLGVSQDNVEQWLCRGQFPKVDPRRTVAEPPVAPGLAPHGTHAAFNRHRKRGETPCYECGAAERTFQRLRKRRARAGV